MGSLPYFRCKKHINYKFCSNSRQKKKREKEKGEKRISEKEKDEKKVERMEMTPERRKERLRINEWDLRQREREEEERKEKKKKGKRRGGEEWKSRKREECEMLASCDIPRFENSGDPKETNFVPFI